MEHAPVPLRFGTLVVFTDGTDRAHRASAEDVDHALDAAGFETYVIGAGQEVDKGQLSRIGRSGTFASQNRADVQNGFDESPRASRRRRASSTCCRTARPSRGGEHEVEVEAHAPGTAARSATGSTPGFGPNCDPNQRPAFDVHHPRAPPPPNVAEAPPPSHAAPAAAPVHAPAGWAPKR